MRKRGREREVEGKGKREEEELESLVVRDLQLSYTGWAAVATQAQVIVHAGKEAPGDDHWLLKMAHESPPLLS